MGFARRHELLASLPNVSIGQLNLNMLRMDDIVQQTTIIFNGQQNIYSEQFLERDNAPMEKAHSKHTFGFV